MKLGYVPTARVAPLIADLIAERWPDGGGDEILAENVGCDPAQIRKCLTQKYAETKFDFADTLLGALGRPDMWQGVLADVYDECDLRTAEERDTRFVPEERKCGHCDSGFLAVKRTQTYCTAVCRRRAGWLRENPPRVLALRICGWCENEFAPKRKDSRFCSLRCMNQNNYHRQGGAERQHARRVAA